MPAANTTKTTKKASSSPSKKSGAASAPKKKAVKMDPYDDPFAPSPKPKQTKRKTSSSGSSKSSKTKAKKIEENPLGMMALDPYDDPWAEPAKKPAKKASSRNSSARSRTSPTRAKAPKYDPFDEPPMPKSGKKAVGSSRSSAKSRSKGSNSGGRKRRGSGYLTFLLSSMIIICVLLISMQLYNYTKFMQMRDTVEGNSYFAGTIIDGVDISNMTMEDAVVYWETNIEPQYYNRTVTLDNGMSVTALELGYTSNYRTVIDNAWKAQTTGTLAERYAALTRPSTGSGYTVTRVMYSSDAVDNYSANVASGIDSSVKEPSITGFDHDALSFTFAEGSPGKVLDQEKLSADIKTAMDSGGGSVSLSITTTQPKHTVADMQSMYGLRAYAVTNASSSSSNRLTNIRLALSSINGTLLQPGEEFSFNAVVGKRTTAKGYKAAPAYNSGEVVEEVGGGICQVSTTLFNAAVKSGLKIVERHNHSMPVAYVDKGKDAAVSWGAQDLRFVNNTSEPVYIVAFMDDDKRVRIGFFGRLIDDGQYITVESKVTYTREFETEYQFNAFLLPGAVEELQSGRNTYEAITYKCTWTAEGELISREELCKSTYRGRNRIIEYGP